MSIPLWGPAVRDGLRCRERVVVGYAWVDAADYAVLARYRWSRHAQGYAVRSDRRRLIYMHREIMQPTAGVEVDHIDRRPSNNTRANLRVCTHRENMRNRRPNATAVKRTAWWREHSAKHPPAT